jgi:hypothetical protein
MIYDKEYFIKKFEAIPENRWIAGSFSDKLDNSKHCALGHCGESANTVTDDGIYLAMLFRCGKHEVTQINDGIGFFKEYGSTPKERILNALRQLP